ncbi:hypothetical protein BH09ACT12_BH09ACT12_18460 [soil metagenome]
MPVRLPARLRSAYVVAALIVAAGLLPLLGLPVASVSADPGTDAPPVTAARVARTSEISQVSAGGEFSCGIREASRLWCWGRNTYGQLGTGSTANEPVAPTMVKGRGKWKQVSAGGSTTCGVRNSGALYCWGLNHRGQVGDGQKAAVPAPKRIPGRKNWEQAATGWFHTCAVKAKGAMWCWGDNSWGQLGQGNNSQDLNRHRVPGSWVSVAAAGWTTCGIKKDGTLWCWGRNTFGQLGTGDLGERFRPTQVVGSSKWSEVALSWTHGCGLQLNGMVRCWGRNDLGQVGDGAPIYTTAPTEVPGGHRAKSVAVGEGSSCLVDLDGALWCWGDNRFGQIAGKLPAVPAARVPVKRKGSSYESVSGGWYHYCASTSAQKAVCWGDNERGQLGDNGPGSRSKTPAFTSPPADPGAPLNFRLASMNTLGNHHTHPFADADRFGPSRVRADWTSQMLVNNGIQVAGIQEQDAGQLAAIVSGSEGRFASFPEPSAGDLGVESTILWDTTDFEALETRVVQMQFIARVLPRPIVKLRQISTGQEFYVMAVHNAPNDYQAKRNKATKVQLKEIQKLEETGLPVFYVGDMNEKKTIFCKTLQRTGLVSASGGRLKPDGTCVTPRTMRVDWIFGPEATQWGGFEFTKPPLARLSTDHWVPVVDVVVP